MTKSTYLGKCMYCGQQAMLEINDDIVASYEDKPDDWDTYISEEATKICKCEGARAWWNVERRVRKAEDECLKLANSEQIGEVLKAAARPVMRSEFDKLTIKDGGLPTVCTLIVMNAFMSVENIRSQKIRQSK